MPIACAAIWLGPPWFVFLVAAAAAIMGWEWGRLVGRVSDPIAGAVIMLVAGLPVLLAGLVSLPCGLAAGGALILLQELAVLLGPLGTARPRRTAWTVGGLAWIVLSMMALAWLRALPAAADRVDGFDILVFIASVVWSVDIGAYVAGKLVGGPRLAPRLSPKKTWAGLVGGVAAAVLASWVAGRILGWPAPSVIALLSTGLAVVEQMGDMAESYAKRRFGVKDTSQLIPGHGGLLDRLDGLLAVAVAVTFIVVFR